MLQHQTLHILWWQLRKLKNEAAPIPELVLKAGVDAAKDLKYETIYNTMSAAGLSLVYKIALGHRKSGGP